MSVYFSVKGVLRLSKYYHVLHTVDLATFLDNIGIRHLWTTHSLLPRLLAYLHIKCGKLTTGHPWNLLSIVHGSHPFVLTTYSTFGCSLFW